MVDLGHGAVTRLAAAVRGGSTRKNPARWSPSAALPSHIGRSAPVVDKQGIGDGRPARPEFESPHTPDFVSVIQQTNTNTATAREREPQPGAAVSHARIRHRPSGRPETSANPQPELSR